MKRQRTLSSYDQVSTSKPICIEVPLPSSRNASSCSYNRDEDSGGSAVSRGINADIPGWLRKILNGNDGDEIDDGEIDNAGRTDDDGEIINSVERHNTGERHNNDESQINGEGHNTGESHNTGENRNNETLVPVWHDGPGTDEGFDEVDSTQDDDGSTCIGSPPRMEVKDDHRTYRTSINGEIIHWQPNDKDEFCRRGILHQLIRETLQGKDFLSPVIQPQLIVDASAGTGHWAIDVADQFPAALVRGYDVRYMQPNSVPNNLQLYVVHEEGSFSGRKLDFLFCRAVEIPWESFIRDGFESLKDGKYIEIQYMSLKPQGISKADSKVREWDQKLSEAMITLMVDTGFINIEVKEYKWPLNPSLELGRMCKVVFTDALESMSTMFFMNKLGFKLPDAIVLTCQARQEIYEEPDAFVNFYVLYGQRPPRNGVSGGGSSMD
ncbi:hypothetical protein NQ176_g1623 [Zarea fungicola]|uniref:Uncharacterized protein n=1 Tax=Zarea fungicola TaxID=93591 RepID=A0ACC1NUJ0_9HYPO|nr:hypothetical protein NQ176_g1623 [Lecanicillium fungicola]